ncbi:hypothetical protein ABPG77_004333 [Micractinium sp. CCAP 211/92]
MPLHQANATRRSARQGKQSEEPQQCHQPGASVWDQTHHQSRGYGTIKKEGEPADDGTPRWYVDWAVKQPGSRETAISERYLALSHVHHTARMPPSGLRQPIVVQFGNLKGHQGKTEQKSGDQWKCKLEGVDGLHSFHCDHLHATGEPPAESKLAPFDPKVLATDLPATDVPEYLAKLQFDPEEPIDLRRIHPESQTVCDLMTGGLLATELDDATLRRLRYKATGASGGSCS